VELLLAYAWHDNSGQLQRTDVRAEVALDHFIDELTTALAQHAGLTDPMNIVVRRTGLALDPLQTIEESGVFGGDELMLFPASQRVRANGPRNEALVSLDIMGGPDAGRFVLLAPGQFKVGQDRSCAVRLNDSSVELDHAVIIVSANGSVSIAPRAGCVVAIDNAVVPDATSIGASDVVRLGSSTFSVRPISATFAAERDLLGHVPFHRTPYRPVVVQDRVLPELGPVPKQRQQRRFTVATMMLPLASGVGMAVISHRPEFLLLTGIAPIVMVYNWWDDRRHGRRSFQKESAEFRVATSAYVGLMHDALETEEEERRGAAPDLSELHRRAHYRTRSLWERNREADDLLTVRIGLGTLASKVKVTVDERGEETLHDEAVAALAGSDQVHNVPVQLDLRGLGGVAVWGDPDRAGRLAASILLQAVSLQSPEDVVIVAATASSRADTLAWLKWTPHTRAASSPLGGAHLVTTTEAAEVLLADVVAALSRRRQSPHGVSKGPWLLIVLDERLDIDAALLSMVFDQLSGADASVLWIGDHEHRVPRHCQAIIDVPTTGSGRAWFTDPTRSAIAIDLELANPEGARRAALALAPVRDASAAAATASLPRTVTLFEALGLNQVSADAVDRAWSCNDRDGLRFPIGQGAQGPFVIDLVRQGPHTLIAGTSGAGKSELLQTMVTSLAFNYSPEQVTFLFVDYKGGASSADFAHLPHTVGSVTNLGVGMARRALISLQAELTWRMAIMEGRAKDLAEFTHLFPNEAPPRLVIMVDEFATLAKELPDFVAGVVDIAQRGRSLGIHLVLATQRPAGAVNENILANTNLRLGLRMLDPADSVSVLNASDAADIPVPLVGRAIARTGRRELTPFQTAWAGAQVRSVTEQRRAIEIAPFDGSMPLHSLAASGDGEAGTQLQAVVAAAQDAHQRSGRSLPRRPWLDPLQDVVSLDLTSAVAESDPGRVVALGTVDRPERQSQEPALVDLEETGGLIVLGMGGSGKSTLLRTAALHAASQGSPSDVVIFGIDAAGRGLSPLKALPHTALIASADDVEAVTRLISHLQSEIERRRLVMSEVGVESMTSLRRSQPQLDLPRILFLIDGYGSLQSMCDSPELFTWAQTVQRIITDGRAVGLHTILSVDRRMSVPGALASAMAARVVLRMADAESLVDCGVMSTVAKQVDLSIPGRAVFGRSDIMQTAVAGGEDPAQQNAAIAAWGSTQLRQYAASDLAPAALPTSCFAGPSPARWVVGLGQQDLSNESAVVDLATSHLTISGPAGSGRTAAVLTVAEGLVASGVQRVALLSATSHSLPGVVSLRTSDDLAPLVSDLEIALGRTDGRGPDMVLIIDDADRIQDAALMAILERIVRDDRVRLVVAVDSRVVSGGYQSGWMGELRRFRRQLLLQPASAADVTAVTGGRATLRPGLTFPPGRGVLVSERTMTVVQLGVSDRDSSDLLVRN
jgi:DNA segregation ATPase FtsK/SpoIIIE, S-DNA-T family